jgi:DNA-binding response OmpR family regulator
MRTALIVEDEKKVRELYGKFLQQEGFNVLEAENGEKAGLLLMKEKEIDLILLDVRMPVVGGATLFHLIKLHHSGAKVIIVSVYPLEDQRRLIDGADAYFDKSQGAEKLMAKIRTMMRTGAVGQR